MSLRPDITEVENTESLYVRDGFMAVRSTAELEKFLTRGKGLYLLDGKGHRSVTSGEIEEILADWRHVDDQDRVLIKETGELRRSLEKFDDESERADDVKAAIENKELERTTLQYTKTRMYVEAYRLNSLTESLIFMTIPTGMPEITERNYSEMLYRLRELERVNGVFMPGPKGARTVTDEEVKRHIGLKTNATPYTNAQFAKNIKRIEKEKREQ